MLFLGIILLLASSVVNTQGQVSGNAMDLANMNINMMHRKCPIQTCQTVCLQKQESGCFLCNPSCSSGSNLALPDGGLPITSGQGSFYTGCHGDSNWMNCPLSCEHKYDGKGCFQCLCQPLGVTTSATTAASMDETKTAYHQQTEFQTKTSSSPLSALSVTEEATLRSVATSFVPIETADTTMAVTSSMDTTRAVPISHVVSESDTGHVSSAPSNSISDHSTESLTDNQTLVPLAEEFRTPSAHVTTQRAVSASAPIDIVPNTGDSLPVKNEHDDNAETFDFKPNTLSFVLLGLVLVFVLLSLGFLFAWRNTVTKLGKYKDDLYFVHKTYRQDSTTRLSDNDMIEPIYTDTTPTPPQPPPRNLHDGRKLPPIRTLSLTDETLLTYNSPQQTEIKHDYLELI